MYLHPPQVFSRPAVLAELIGFYGRNSRAPHHQISVEECAKIDMLGAHATSMLMGHEVDDDRIAKVFREHKLKNYANAYNATVTPAEEEARTRGDWKASSEAFKKFQRDFHVKVNTIKNAASTLTTKMAVHGPETGRH